MSEPIVFISHFKVKEGKLDGVERFLRQGSTQLHEEKPRTLLFLAYLDHEGTLLTIVHVFADADAMDHHVQGAEERTGEAYEFLEPLGSEIYGTPNARVLEMFRQVAASEAGVTFHSRYVDGFLRLGSG